MMMMIPMRISSLSGSRIREDTGGPSTGPTNEEIELILHPGRAVSCAPGSITILPMYLIESSL